MCDQVVADLGGVDILVNNAGRSIRRSLALSYDRLHDYQRTMQLNYCSFSAQPDAQAVTGDARARVRPHRQRLLGGGADPGATLWRLHRLEDGAETLCDAWQAETRPDDVRFTTVHMALVRTPMIEATTMIDRFPALTPEDAAEILCRAIIHRPRLVTVLFGSFASFADAVSPQICMDRVRSRGFQLFNDPARPRAARPHSPTSRSASRARHSPNSPVASIGRSARHESGRGGNTRQEGERRSRHHLTS